MLFKFKSFIIIEIWLTMLLLFSHSIVSNSLQPYGLQHTRLPCPSLSARLCSVMSIESMIQSNHLTLCHPFLLSPSASPSIRVFPMSQFFTSGGQSIGASASVLPMNLQGWFPLGLIDLISLQSKRLSRVFSSTTFKSISSSALSFTF